MSAPLLTLPISVVPRRASARSSSATPASRYRDGRRRRTGRRTVRPARHDWVMAAAIRPPTLTRTPPWTGCGAAGRGRCHARPEPRPRIAIVRTSRSSDSVSALTDASDRRMPVTTARMVPSSPAASSNMTRSDGRQASCHARTASSAPPAAKARAAATRKRCGGACDQVTKAHTTATANVAVRKVCAEGASATVRPAAAPARRPSTGTAATARMVPGSAKDGTCRQPPIRDDTRRRKSWTASHFDSSRRCGAPGGADRNCAAVRPCSWCFLRSSPAVRGR